MPKRLWVYIMASRSRTIYVGVTNNIHRRVREHRSGKSGFTSRYRITRLVYAEPVEGALVAIAREKQIKGWIRARKVALVESSNPEWEDLAAGWDRVGAG